MVGKRLRCRRRCSLIRPRCGDICRGSLEPVRVGAGAASWMVWRAVSQCRAGGAEKVCGGGVALGRLAALQEYRVACRCTVLPSNHTGRAETPAVRAQQMRCCPIVSPCRGS